MRENDTYRRLSRKRKTAMFICIAAMAAFAFWDIITGSSSLTPLGTLKIILDGPTGDSKYHFIVWYVRMPMTLTCIGVGASLGMAGEQMQTILQNPLASPYTLGISSAAGFGAAFGVITGFPFVPVAWLNNSLSALIFAMGASIVIFTVSKRRNTDTKGMVLLGIVITFFFSALQSLMQYMASQEQLSEIMHWMFGSLSKSSWTGVRACLITFITIFLLSGRLSWQLTALSAGEDRAQSLGVHTEHLKQKTFLYASILTAVSVSYVGSIGFIGLVAPHFARSYVGEDQRFLAPLAAVFGILILLAASIISKILKPGEILPVGIITNLVGVTFLLYLIIRKKI